MNVWYRFVLTLCMKNMIYEWIWKVDNIFSFISNQFNLAFHRLLYIYLIGSYHLFILDYKFFFRDFVAFSKVFSKTADVSSFPQTVSGVGNDGRIGENHEQDFPGLAGPFLSLCSIPLSGLSVPNKSNTAQYSHIYTLAVAHTLLPHLVRVRIVRCT